MSLADVAEDDTARLAGGPRLDDLPLADLRRYRQWLRTEEDRTSYWRRLVHGRIDLVVAQRGTTGSMSLPDLVRVLGDTGSGASRRALIRVHPGDPLPDLPDLEQVWATPEGEAESAEVLERLRRAEVQLADYRAALLRLLDESTALLVRRYRDDPTAALEALG